MKSDSSLEWFTGLIARAIRQRNDVHGRGGIQRLATETGIADSTLQRWAKGENANLSLAKASDFIVKIGGDIRRALPDWTPPPSGSEHTAEVMRVVGLVEAGRVDRNELEPYDVFASPRLWKDSKYYPITHGDVQLLEVHGDSMLPEYESGDIVAVRAPQALPGIERALDGVPVIFQSPDGETFKIFRLAADGRVIGQPLNSSIPFVVFDPEDEVQVTHVVLGKLAIHRGRHEHKTPETKKRRRA